MDVLLVQRRKATNNRIYLMYKLLCTSLEEYILNRVKEHLDDFHTCNRDYIIVFDLLTICRMLTRKDSFMLRLQRGDEDVISHLLTFLHHGPSPYLPVFSSLGIQTSLLQHIINFCKVNSMSAFNLSDPEKSSKVLVQIVLKPNVSDPVPLIDSSHKLSKRARYE